MREDLHRASSTVDHCSRWARLHVLDVSILRILWVQHSPNDIHLSRPHIIGILMPMWIAQWHCNREITISGHLRYQWTLGQNFSPLNFEPKKNWAARKSTIYGVFSERECLRKCSERFRTVTARLLSVMQPSSSTACKQLEHSVCFDPKCSSLLVDSL